MTSNVYLLLVEYGRERERDALDTLVTTIRRMFPGGPPCTVVVDNARIGADPVALNQHTDRIAGDNALHEFSGWDRGLAWLRRKHQPDPDAIVVLANDTVARADKVERVRNLPADRAAGARHGALVGWIDEYPRPVRLFEMEWRQWVDTSLVLTTWRTLAALAPLAAPLDDRQLFDHDWRRIFKEPSPLSDNYRTYLRRYFVGDCTDAEFNHDWYAQAPVTAANFDALKAKLGCVFCEHLLSARARTLGIPLVDIRPQSLPIDPFPVESGNPVTETPKISVLIPCYNLGAFLDEAVDSVLAQTYQNFEIVVVNDGSTDAGTNALLADYQRPRTRVIHMSHSGVSAARNLAIAQTTGPYLCALDADDRLEPTYFEKAVSILDTEPVTTFVSCWLRTFGDEEWEWKPDRCDLPTVLWEDTILTASLVRRQAVEAVGGYDTRMPIQGLEDWDLWLMLAERGYRGVILREVLFNYRRRPGSLSTVSWNGSGHLPLMEYRLAKHSGLYRKHLIDVLLHQDTETAAMLRRNDDIERYIATELEPTVAARQAELAALNLRLASFTSTPPHASDRTRELEAALTEAAAEVRALRTSMSWRVTAPLRRAYDWWLRARSAP